MSGEPRPHRRLAPPSRCGGARAAPSPRFGDPARLCKHATGRTWACLPRSGRRRFSNDLWFGGQARDARNCSPPKTRGSSDDGTIMTRRRRSNQRAGSEKAAIQVHAASCSSVLMHARHAHTARKHRPVAGWLAMDRARTSSPSVACADGHAWAQHSFATVKRSPQCAQWTDSQHSFAE
jgi:hypothetical protein